MSNTTTTTTLLTLRLAAERLSVSTRTIYRPPSGRELGHLWMGGANRDITSARQAFAESAARNGVFIDQELSGRRFQRGRRLMATIKRGENSKGPYWDVRWRDPVTGEQRRKRLRTRGMADRWLADALDIEGYGVQLAHLRPVKVSFGWVIDEWWDWKYPRLAPTTRSSWTSSLNHIPKAIREREIRTVTTPEIEDLLDRVAKASGYSAAKTLRTVLSNIFNYGLKHSYATFNPVEAADTPKPERRGGASGGEWVDPKLVPSPAEVMRIADNARPEYRALVLVLGIAGLRLSEALALEVNDVDLVRRRIYVRKSQSAAPKKHSYTGEALELNDPKSQASFREVVIPEALSEELDEHLRIRTGDSQRLFVTSTGAVISPSNFRNREFSKAVQAAEVSVPCTPHVLRHTAASILIEAGIGPARVASQLGHSNAAVVLKIYAGFWRREDDKVAEALEAALDELRE